MVKEKVKHGAQDTNGEKVKADHEELRAWAVAANKAQAERQRRRLSQEESGSTEGSALMTVPESHPSPRTLEDEREPLPDLVISPQNCEKPTLQFVGYSEALNMNAQTTPLRRRRRGASRSMRREFAATDDIPGKPEAEQLLNLVQGHLVVWPYDW